MLDRLGGCLVSLPTPFSNGTLDAARFAAFVDWHISQGSKRVVVAGELGEASTLTIDERDAVIRIAVDVSAGRVPVIAGVIANGTEKASALGRAAAVAGADGVLVTVPYYNKPTQDGMVAHFQAVAKSAGLAILLHNAPANTAADLLPTTIAKLAGCPGIVGVVDACADPQRLEKIAQLTPPEFLRLAGDDARGPEHVILAGQGWLSVGAAVVPRLFSGLYAACAAGDAACAGPLQKRLDMFIRALGREASPGTVKYALKLIAKWDAELRLPLVAVSSETAEEIGAAVLDLQIPEGLESDYSQSGCFVRP